MVESLWQKVGGTRLPLQTHDIDATALTFETSDPALDVITDLCAAAIRGELGTGADSAWATVCAALPTGHRLAGSTDPVGAVWKIEPSATAVRQVKPSWPLLAVWRTGEAEVTQRTLSKTQHVQRWTVMWSLGDLEADLGLKLGPVLQYVGKVVTQTIVSARHPNYDSGTMQFGEGRGELSRCFPVEWGAGQAHFSDDEDTKFWAASITIESMEFSSELDQGTDGGALSLTIGGGNALEILPGLVVGDGDHPGTD
jgi:hypothetical protein